MDARSPAQIPDGERASDRLAAALRARGDRRWLRRVSLPAPVIPDQALPTLLPAQASGDGVSGLLWRPPAGPAVVGLGAAWEAEVDGPERLAQAQALAPVLWARLVPALQDPLEAAAPAPRIFAGLAFAPGLSDPVWRGFGDGRLLLPRWSYVRDGACAWLQAVFCQGAGDGLREELDGILAALTAAVHRPQRDEKGGDVTRIEDPRIALTGPSPVVPDWDQLVQQALLAISRGPCTKLVAARRQDLEAATPLDAGAVLRRLIREQRGCTTFAVRVQGAVLVGATPERLVARRGDRVFTEALAGTQARAAAPAELTASGKDLDEHGLVVRHLMERLRPLCAVLPEPPPPATRALRDVLHLHTPIAGSLRAPMHVLELVRALHPTPATAGTPATEAVRWIRAHEPTARGWYAGPIGWFDRRGDGDFAVALRAGVLRGRRAHLYAGAGLVPGSEPARELQETALKLRALRSALGASP